MSFKHLSSLSVCQPGSTLTARRIQLPAVDISNKVPGKGCLDKQRPGPIMRAPHLSDLSLSLFLTLSLSLFHTLKTATKYALLLLLFFFFFLKFCSYLPQKCERELRRNQKMHTHMQTLEQVIINHSRVKLVDTNDTNKSGASATQQRERKTFTSSSFWLILSHS